MAHHYHNIQGWFDFQDIYDEQVQKAPQEGAIFVEVGTWRGKSFCYLGEKVVESGKWIKLVSVDTWRGSNEEVHRNYINDLGGEDKLYYEFLHNMKNANLLSFITPLRMTSIAASQLWADNTLDFVFIDASHEYKDVLADIQHWLPKVKVGGVIAGHDHPWPDVHKAVKEVFGENYQVRGPHSWYKVKES